MMGIEIACGTTKLRCDGNLLQTTQLFLQTIDIDHDLLSQTGGGSRLSMRLGEHRDILPLFSVVIELFNQFLNLWNIHLVECLLDTQGHAGVVDILRCQSEMNKLLVGFQL